MYRKNCTKTKIAYLVKIYKMSLMELFEEVLETQQSDDYDGGFTDWQCWVSNMAVALFKWRLERVNYRAGLIGYHVYSKEENDHGKLL